MWAARVLAGQATTSSGASVAELTSVLGDSYTPLPEPIPAEADRFAGPEERERSSDEPSEPIVPIEMDGDGPLVVREKFHRADPMTIDQALLEMELVGHDFYLFRDKESGHPSVVYRRVGYAYGVLRLEEP